MDLLDNLHESGSIPDQGKAKVVDNRSFVRRPGVIITIALTALAVGGGSAAVIASQYHPAAVASSTPSKAPSATVPPESSAPVTPEAIPTAQSLKLDPALINNPEELTKTVDNTLTHWINSGSGELNAKPAMASADYTAYAANIAGGYDDVYKKALLPDNWESKQSLLDWVNNASTIHAQTLAFNYGTTPSLKIDSANKEAYAAGYRYVSFDGAVTNPDKSVTITDTFLAYDNSKQNSMSQHTSQAVDGKELRTSTTYAVINGELKIIGKTAGQGIN